MKIQYLNGGLANQVFQYIFVRFAQLYQPGAETILLDDSFFFVNHMHNGYELEKVFGLKPALLSEYFEEDVWNFIVEKKRQGISVCQSIKDIDVDITMISEMPNYKTVNPFDGEVIEVPGNDFYPQVLDASGNIYYHGYWINKNWFNSYRDIFLAELVFPAVTDERNREYERRILTSSSLGVHIRRGDYVTLGWDLKADYYRQTLEGVKEQYPEMTLFVFSDDVEWCKKSAADLGFHYFQDVVFVEGNIAGNNYIDLYLMSLCEGLVMSISAFCYLAALLNRRLKFVCNPTEREV